MNYEELRYGSAEFASSADLRHAGLLNGQGISIGHDYSKHYELRIQGDGSIAMLAGTGSSKSAAGFVNPLVGGHLPGNFICFSPRGEIDAVSMLSLSLQGYELYFLNPTGMLDLPQHRTNPKDNQTLESPSLIADIQKDSLDFIPKPIAAKSTWSYEDAQRWYTDLSLYDAERNGCASITGVYELITTIQGKIDLWCDHLSCMSKSRFPSVRSFAHEIFALQEEGRESFTAPLGVLQNAFEFMRDPRLQHMLSGSDFSLQWLTDPNRKIGVFVDWPIDYIESQAAAIRTIFGAVIQNKMRNPSGALVSVLIDEAGQLKRFESLRQLFTFGRGAGLVSNIAAWQEISQIEAAFGPEANEIIGSAQFRVFKGVRTMQSAEMVSRMCGTMTLDYDPEMEHSEARRQKIQTVNHLLSGGDFLTAMSDLRHYRQAETHRRKQSRALLSADEVLNLPPTQMVAFASGILSKPILGHWIPHFARRDFAGKYLNNPYHGERVRVQTRWGSKLLSVIEETVPSKLGHLPQYQNGLWRYVEGYRPNI